MAVPTLEAKLYAIRDCVFSETITLQNDNTTPVNTSGAQGLFVIRSFPGGPVLFEADNTEGVSFGTSNLTVTIQPTVFATFPRYAHYDLFIQLSGDVKKKILRGQFELE